MRSQSLPAACRPTVAYTCRTAVLSRPAVECRPAVYRHTAAYNCRTAAYKCRTAVLSRSRATAYCRSVVNGRTAAYCRLAVYCRPVVYGRLAVSSRPVTRCRGPVDRRPTASHHAGTRCRPAVHYYLATYHTAKRGPGDCWTTGQNTVTCRDRRGLGTAAAQPREVPTGEPKSMEGTRVPRSHGASEDDVQRIGGQSSHQSKDVPDVRQEWSGVAGRQPEEQPEAVRRRKCHQLWRGLKSAGPTQSSDAETEYSVRSPGTDEPSEAPPKLDATCQVRQGLISGVLALRSSAKTEYSCPDSDGGEGGALRVNMIRVHGKQGEERNEPKFGNSRAAPPQGADSGRPSGSGEHRSVGQERRIEPTGVQHQYNLGSFRFQQPHQQQEVLDVPYSTVSSEERYGGTGKYKGARPKTSTYILYVHNKCYLFQMFIPISPEVSSVNRSIDQSINRKTIESFFDRKVYKFIQTLSNIFESLRGPMIHKSRITIVRLEIRLRQTVPMPTTPGPSTFGNVLVWIGPSGKENTYM